MPLVIGVTVVVLVLIFLAIRPGDSGSSPAGVQTPAPSPDGGGEELDLSPWQIGGEGSESGLERPHAILNFTIPDTELVIESVGQYTGPNLEDGQDTPTGNAASIVLRNDSDRVLQYAAITLQAGDAQVPFQVTTLLPGARVQAIALDGQAYQPDVSYSFISCEPAYCDTVSKLEDQFTVSGASGSLTLTNKSDQTYGHVSVYYKYMQGDLYLGGITYRCTFEDVAPGAALEQPAGHYNPDSSVILMLTTGETPN